MAKMQLGKRIKDKKITIILLLILVVVVIVGSLFFFEIPPFGKSDSDEESIVDKNIRIIQKNFDTKIYLYGTDIPFPKELSYTKVESVEEAINSTKGDYSVIIVNNLKGKGQLTNDDYAALADYCKLERQAVMILSAEVKRDFFMEQGTGAVISGSLGSMFYLVSGTVVEYTGFWSEEAEEYIDTYEQNISICITDAITDFIKDVNQ